MRLNNKDIFVAVIIAVLNVLWALLPNRSSVISIILVLPLVFVVPGYMLTQGLFHNRSLDVPRQLVFSIGFSFVIDIFSGFLLNLLPTGLRALSWATLLALLTTAFSLLVFYLRKRTTFKRASVPRLHFTIKDSVLLGFASLIVCFAVLYSVISAIQQPRPGFTQLWMTPQVQAGKGCAVQVGMQNFETTSTAYRITVTTNGKQLTSWPSIILAPQQKWQQVLPIISDATDTLYVEAQLYRLDQQQTTYRSVHLTLTNTAESTNGKKRTCNAPSH